ncbi:MAG: hypothetical protein IJM25_12805 [Eubacterium sp.]|nr:hypothetical protein [Eubacterium sp.]
MYKLFFIAKNNMKRQKGDMITFFILTLIAAFLIFDCASAMLGMGQVMEDRYQAVNGAEVLLVISDKEQLREAADAAFAENSHLQDYEASELLNVTTKYRNTKDEDFDEYQFFAEAFEDQRKYMNLEFQLEGKTKDQLRENDVIMPYYIRDRFPIGDTLELKIDDKSYEFTVVGYTEDPYMASALNISIFHIFISKNRLDQIVTETEGTSGRFMMYKGKVKDGALTADFGTGDLEKEIGNSYKDKTAIVAKEHPELNVTNYMILNWKHMKSGGQILPMIVMAIFLLFAVIILIVATLIISFSVKNFIQRNMKNTGILEASGYTVKELRHALTVEILLVAGLGSVLGVMTGIITFGGFGNVVSSTLGLSWNQPANIPAAALTVAGLLLLVWLISVRISRMYKKITVLEALRGGLGTHNYRKNHFSFEKTSLPVPVTLSLKETFGNPRRNIAMVLIMTILTIAMLSGFGMLENFGTDPDALIVLTGTPNSQMELHAEDGLTEDLKKVEGITNVDTMFTLEPTVWYGERSSAIYTRAVRNPEDGFEVEVLEGRLPRQDNEVMLTTAAADDLGVKIGDIIKIEFGGVTEEYLLTGLNQMMQQMGRTMILTEEGGLKLLPAKPKYTYDIYADKNISFDTLKERVETAIAGKGGNHVYTDIGKFVDESMNSLMGAMGAICLVFTVVTLLIVFFVEALVIRAKMVREWRGMGISKAMGMTSGGLIGQIMLSNIPAIVAGVVLGTLLAPTAGYWGCRAIFAMFGIKKVDFTISVLAILITAAGIIAVALVTSGLFGLKVRKLQPVEMITEE